MATAEIQEGGRRVISVPYLQNPEWFSAFAKTYARNTGNTTSDIFAATLPDINATVPITADSIVHDNAAGPAIAASVIIQAAQGAGTAVPRLVVTDNAPGMVAAAQQSMASFETVEVKAMDSYKLEYPDNSFTHSILNFSIMNMENGAGGCLAEIYRTLKPGGVSVITWWQRFGPGNVVHAAQAMVRPDLPRMFTGNPELYHEGALERYVLEAGFQKEKTRVERNELVATGDRLAALKDFLLGPLIQGAKHGWTEEEAARWPEVLDKALDEETKANGGILFQSWVLIAVK